MHACISRYLTIVFFVMLLAPLLGHAGSSIPLEKRLAGDGGDEGIQVDANGKVGIGSTPGSANLVVGGVTGLPLSEWSYKQEVGARHIGPMAQAFHAAFGLGDSDESITTIDADGVALAAIQGLNAKLETELASQKAQIEAQQQQIAALTAEITEYRTVVAEVASLKQSLGLVVARRD